MIACALCVTFAGGPLKPELRNDERCQHTFWIGMNNTILECYRRSTYVIGNNQTDVVSAEQQTAWRTYCGVALDGDVIPVGVFSESVTCPARQVRQNSAFLMTKVARPKLSSVYSSTGFAFMTD